MGEESLKEEHRKRGKGAEDEKKPTQRWAHPERRKT
jgi:hypothetical protein